MAFEEWVACHDDFIGLIGSRVAQSLVADESFQHILRVLNTNVDGKQKIMFALTSIKGIGRRFANLVCKKAEVDMTKRCAAALQPAVGCLHFYCSCKGKLRALFF